MLTSIEETSLPKTLSRFTIKRANAGYNLHIEDIDGETLELSATAELLDVIAEAIDEHFAEDEADAEAN